MTMTRLNCRCRKINEKKNQKAEEKRRCRRRRKKQKKTLPKSSVSTCIEILHFFSFLSIARPHKEEADRYPAYIQTNIRVHFPLLFPFLYLSTYFPTQVLQSISTGFISLPRSFSCDFLQDIYILTYRLSY